MIKLCCNKPTLPKNEFWFSFIGLIGFYLGALSTSSLSSISVYLTSYIHEKQDFVTMYHGLFIRLIHSFGSGIGQILGGILEYKLGLFLTTLLGLCIVLLSNIFFIDIRNIWLCYAITLTSALGQGIAGSLVGKNVVLYKPDKKALLSSIFTGISVLFGAGYAYLIEKLVNPDGYTLKESERYYPPKYCSKTNLYFVIGFFAIPIGAFIFTLFTFEYKKNNKDLNKNEDPTQVGGIIDEENEEENEENDNGKGEELYSINDKEKNEEKKTTDKESESKKAKEHIKIALKTIRFWRQCILALFLIFSASFISSTSRTFGADIGIDGKALQNLIPVETVISLIEGMIVGFCVDKKGALFFLRIGTIIVIIPGILLGLFTTKTAMFILSFIILVIGAVPLSICFGPYIMDIYGIQESVILGGILGMFTKLSEIATTVIAFVISEYYDTKEEIIKRFQIIYYICAGLAFLSFMLLLFEKNQKIDYDERKKGKKVENEQLSED